MASEVIGPARCPLCGGTARLSLAKTKLTVMTMNCCNAQLFARSDRSDALMRELLLPPEAAADPVRPPAPAPQPPARTENPPAPAPQPAPEPVRTGNKPPAPAPAPAFGGLLKW